ncbi:hypothetical protein D9757_002175 [Collybiopsis confluens]|uniref:Poly A polymerase head domain-containing protein n=1 Tax=Collybiopsis confluens TaxID=2823264 RepID=A0A8H5I0I5_9AGAR|nr:hypothetical protein D9757_002175 [Collybiopsis confluens]
MLLSHIKPTVYLLKRHIHLNWRNMGFISLQNRAVERVTAPAEMKVQLTDAEENICELLDKCRDHIQTENGISTTCRIAGGWVRDKLLGSQSNDIDVALSDMMGLSFAEHLAEFAKSQNIPVGTISKIAQNPDQSKHLETATFKLLGLELDLVNLRSEEYTSNSRIPTEVRFGTPVQDALRRDTTINALFYNVHTRKVEDFTERGLDDLRSGIIRTPLAPKETFFDDPLRVIRCIRFASMPDDPRLIIAQLTLPAGSIGNKSYQGKARNGIDQNDERHVKHEIALNYGLIILSGRDPVQSIFLIHQLSLFDSIFSAIPDHVRSTFSQPPSSKINSLIAVSVLEILLASPSSTALPAIHPLLLSAIQKDPTSRDRLYLASTLIPYLGINYKDAKNKEFPAVSYVIRESLKLGKQSHYLDGIPPLFEAADILRQPDLTSEKFKHPSERVAIGLRIRHKAVHYPDTGSHWTSSLLFSLVRELVECCDSFEQGLNESAASEKIALYNKFVERVEELDLTAAADAKPLLDGGQVVTALNAKAGPWTGAVLARVIEWQLEHPNGSKEECLSWLKEQHISGKLTIGLDEPASKRARTRK